MKDFISWNVIDECVLDIAEHLLRTEIKFEGVYGIPRGGTLLSVMLSHKLDIPYLKTLNAMYGKSFIVIDDIVDTGKTMKHYSTLEVCKNAYYVTIHEHEQSSVKPGYSVLYKEDKWIVYPWEIKDSAEIQDYIVEVNKNG